MYFVVQKEVAAFEMLAHRVIWAVPFGAVIIHYRRQWPDVVSALKHRRTLLYLTVSALLIAANWLVYIWSVQLEQINQASLCYYINPLLFFALAARHLNLSTVGMMQFIAPTLQFLIAVYYGEALTIAHIICFSLIWLAVIVFSVDAWRLNRAVVSATVIYPE